MIVIKKDGTKEAYNPEKIRKAVTKSAERVMVRLSAGDYDSIVNWIDSKIKELELEEIPIATMHSLVECALDNTSPEVAKSYRSYRNYKTDFVAMLDEVYTKAQSLNFLGDKENSNTDSALVATKRCLVFNELNKRLYRKFFMTNAELEACKAGYIYIHDQSARRDTMNCFSRSTRFITDKGVKSFYDFTDGDEVRVLSHKGVWRKAVVHSYGWQPIQKVTFKRGTGKEKQVLVTPNHRWILRDGSDTTNLKTGDKLYRGCLSNKAEGVWEVTQIEPAELASNEQVWCLEVEVDHSFLLEGSIPTGNCCLCDMSAIMKDGFEMGNVWYNEPKSLDTAFDVMGDIILSAASQQYGGFTVPEVDKLLAPYAEKSYKKYCEEYMELKGEDTVTEGCDKWAYNKVKRDYEQGFQGIEYKLNTVGSSRGDYPFITMTMGLGQERFERLASITFFNVHKKGQGKEGHKKPVLFPKLVFLFDKDLHGEGKPLEDVFRAGIECSCKTMYPDWLSLTGEGYVADMYKRYKRVVSPMGCRAFLSPWYERGGMKPADEDDKPVFVGRFNIGAVSLHLPMILAKARRENKDFYEVLDYYLDMIRHIHKRTYDYLGEMKASTNPIMYCEGGFYGGHLKPSDKIKPLLKAATASFGYTALNELQQLYNNKSIREDGEFALEVLKHINDYITKAKEEDSILYAIYGTPAESLCFTGDTLVQTYEGNKAIKDIKAGDLVYSYNEEKKKIELKPVVCAKMTNPLTKVVKITFSNGQTVQCTPNHPFAKRKMVQDSGGKFIKEVIEYTAAKDLKPNDRIKSNYIVEGADGHLRCTTNQTIHDINAEYFFGEKLDGYVIHHKNENKLDNTVENLEYLRDAEHRRLHLKDTIGKFQYKQGDCKGVANTFYGKKHSADAKKKNSLAHLGKNSHNSKPIVQIDTEGSIVATYESKGIAERMTGFSNLSYACNGKYISKKNCHEYKGYLWYFERDIENVSVANHRVVSVEFMSRPAAVYNIEVEGNHNYYVGGNDGILVHNCGLQVEQFRREFGIIEGVSDKPYVSNSFHCHVSEDITPVEKQDKEKRFWDLSNGGKIQYVRYPLGYNKKAVETLVLRAMDMGFYEGVNLSLAYCDDCGHEELEMDTCPVCGSDNLTKVDRMNGYLSYSRVHGDTRLNSAKMAEIADRKSM